MKSKISCFNKTIFKKNITHFWAIWLGLLLWNLFIMPGNILVNYLHNDWESVVNLDTAEVMAQKVYEIVSLVEVYMNPAMLFIFSTIAGMAVFSYLFTFRAANTFHAFPVSRRELFITNYVSGLLFVIVPLFIGAVTGFFAGKMCGYNQLDYIFDGMLAAFGMVFFFYNFAVFVAMVTGQLVAVPIFAIIINFLFVGGKLIIYSLISCISYGITVDFPESKWDVLSPLYYMLEEVRIPMDYSGTYMTCKGMEGGLVILGYVVAAVFILAGAYVLYEKRDIETAGSLISVSWIAPIFRWGAAICFGSVFGIFMFSLINPVSAKQQFIVVLISTVIAGVAVFFFAQMFLEKGFRVFRKKRWIEAMGFAVVTCAALLALENDCFGIEKRVPKPENIKSAFVYEMYPSGGDSKEDIQTILGFHEQLVQNKDEIEAYLSQQNGTYSEYTGLTIRYYLKNGNVLERHYNIPLENTDAGFSYDQLADYTFSAENYLKYHFGMDYEEYSFTWASIERYDVEEDVYNSIDFTAEEAEFLFEAVKKDIEAGNLKETMKMKYYDYERYAKEGFSDALNFEFVYENGNVRDMHDVYYDNVYEEDYWVEQETRGQGSAYIFFSVQCENIINALKELGVIESVEDLMTEQEMNEIEMS